MLDRLGPHIQIPSLELLTRRFVYRQLNPHFDEPWSSVPDFDLPHIGSRVSVFNSATSMFYAPSNHSNVEGMYRETIRSTDLWRRGEIAAPRRDCVLVEDDSREDAIHGLHVARVLLFYSFDYENVRYSCALVHWYKRTDDRPDSLTGMWAIEPRAHKLSVIHVDAIIRGAHLLPVFGDAEFVPHELNYTQTLDAFVAFYLNKYIDHHSHEILI